MKLSTFDKLTAPHRGTLALHMVKRWVATGEPIRPCYTSGTGRFTTNQDHGDRVKAILSALRLPYSMGNDAPRGGAAGQWIKPDAPGWGKMKPIRDAWEAERAETEARIAKEQAEREAKRVAAMEEGLLKEDGDALAAWWRAGATHPAPAEVLKAKEAASLTWKAVTDYCKAKTGIRNPQTN